MKAASPSSALGQAASSILALLGTRPTAALLRAISPLAFVSKDDPPFLIVHGDYDPLVPIQQSASLHSALQAVGVASTSLVAKGGGHGGQAFYNAGLEDRVRAFFQKHL